MKKLFVVLVAIALVASFASAQSVWGQGKKSAGVGAELSLPTGDLGDWVGTGFGGFGLFQYGINDDILATGQVGYTAWGSKDVTQYGGKVSVKGHALYFLVGGKYNLSKQVTPGFYGGLQLGIYSTTIALPTVQAYYGSVGGDQTESKFVFVPAVGYQFGQFDASVKYVINGDVSNLALNVAYIFPL
jgi:hypothetical protein